MTEYLKMEGIVVKCFGIAGGYNPDKKLNPEGFFKTIEHQKPYFEAENIPDLKYRDKASFKVLENTVSLY